MIFTVRFVIPPLPNSQVNHLPQYQIASGHILKHQILLDFSSPPPTQEGSKVTQVHILQKWTLIQVIASLKLWKIQIKMRHQLFYLNYNDANQQIQRKIPHPLSKKTSNFPTSPPLPFSRDPDPPPRRRPYNPCLFVDFYNIINNKTIKSMNKQPQYDLFSIKCIASSFFATYFAGIMHPLDLIKTRFQSHDGKAATDNLVPKYNGIKNALKIIYKDEGIKGLYKGFYISLLCQASSMSFFFWEYETRKSQYQSSGYQTMNAVTRASIEASILTTLITQPIWVIKTRMLLNMNQKISEYENFKKQVREIHLQYGPRGFLRGLELSLVLSLTAVIQMYVYEGSKLLYEKLSIPESPLEEKHFICGSLSKIFSVFLSYPITTLRTRIQQCQFVNSKTSQKYKSVGDLATRTWLEEGLSGFYKGMAANLMKGVSQKGIYFYFYEIFKEVLLPKLSSNQVL